MKRKEGITDHYFESKPVAGEVNAPGPKPYTCFHYMVCSGRDFILVHAMHSKKGPSPISSSLALTLVRLICIYYMSSAVSVHLLLYYLNIKINEAFGFL